MDIRRVVRSLFVAPATSTLPQTRSDIRESASSAARGSDAVVTTPGQQPATPVFLTPQALASFPGAALVINLLWNLVAVFSENVAKLRYVPIVLALLVGALIFLISWNGVPKKKELAIAVIMGLLNSIWLGLNALGIDIVKPPVP